MRVLVVVSLLAAYANAQTCGNAAGSITCNNDKLINDSTACGGDGEPTCDVTACCTVEPVPKCSDTTGLGGGAFDCSSLSLSDGGTKANGEACDAVGCTKQECCDAGQLTCQDVDGYGDGGYLNCGDLDVKTANCNTACDNATCCTQGIVKCTDIDGLNGGPFDCPEPMVLGGGTLAADAQCTGDTCTKELCCGAGPATCGNPNGLDTDTAFDCTASSLTNKDDATRCEDAGGCNKATCCVPGPLTCQDVDGLGGGAYQNCGTSTPVKTENCTGACDNATCCTKGDVTCANKDGLNGGAYQCLTPMSNGGSKAAGVACDAEPCTDTECCTAAAATCQNTTGMPSGPEFADCGALAVKTADCTGACDKATCCTQGDIKCTDIDGLNGGNFDCPDPMVLGGGSIDDDSACTGACDQAQCCGAAAATCQNTSGMPDGVEFADCGAHAVLTADCPQAGCDNATCCTKGDVTCADKDGLNGGAYECTGENMVAGGGSLADGDACAAEPCTDAECCSEAKPQDDDSQAGRVLPVMATALMGAMVIF